jgi:hypothetical protein
MTHARQPASRTLWTPATYRIRVQGGLDASPLRLAPASGLWHVARDTPAEVAGSSHGGAG